jgi:hypothetical protein
MNAKAIAVYYGKPTEKELIKADIEELKKIGFNKFKLSETKQQVMLHCKKEDRGYAEKVKL